MTEHVYKVIHDTQKKLYILVRATSAEYTKVFSSPKRREVMRAYKRVSGFSLEG